MKQSFIVLAMDKDDIMYRLNLELETLEVNERIEDLSNGECQGFCLMLGAHFGKLQEYRTIAEWDTDVILKVIRPFLVNIGCLPNDGTYEEGGA